MIKTHLSRLCSTGCLFVIMILTACNSNKEKYPAQEGFKPELSDKKALEIADNMMDALGGWEVWEDKRFMAWSFYGQYQIWDKKEGLFRHEKSPNVLILSMKKPLGQVFIKGRRVTDSVMANNMLFANYVYVINNIHWLALPYRLKEPGVILKYRSEGKTQDGRPADIIRMTIDSASVNPYKLNDLYFDKESKLLTQWAFFGSGPDQEASFIRKWDGYQDFDGIKLATNRDSKDDTLSISHLVVAEKMPKEIFLSAQPVDKSKVKALAD